MTFAADRNLSSRRDLLFAAAGGLALASAFPARAAENGKGVEPPMASAVPYIEHRISHDGHMIYAREYPGKEPAYVMLHGFPDNLHIYDYVVPYLTQAGTEADARAWAKKLVTDKCTPATVREVWIPAVRRVSSRAEKQHQIRRTPFADISVEVPKKSRNRETKAFTPAEVAPGAHVNGLCGGHGVPH